MVKFEVFNDVGDPKKGLTVEGLRKFLNANKQEEITFDIATLGGDLETALTCYSLLKSHPKKTIANIIGLTASAGTVFALGCDEVHMSDNALFLIHNGWKEATGNVYDFQKTIAELAKTDAIMIKIYREKTGLPDNQIRDIMKASDWMSPNEAKNYGFVDRVYSSGMKIAASVTLQKARECDISKLLLIKLEKKMNLNPFKAPKAKAESVMNILALKEGNLLINAEAAAVGVEVAPLGAMTLEDGEFELADGRKIVVAGGVITEVKEVEIEAAKEVDTEAIVNGVAAMITPVITRLDALEATMAKLGGTHKPVKGAPAGAGKASVIPVHDKVKEITDGIRAKIEETRKA
jgi:ATP-dependent protease ClpP protease subunit